MSKLLWDIREEQALMEKLRAADPTGKWISDFVHSDNPKFAGKSKKERIRMALGASYAAKRQNEDIDIDEAAWGQDKMANLKAAHDRHSEKAIAANRAGDHEAVKVHQSKMNMIKTQMTKLKQNEEAGKDPREYDYEGDMAKSQLRSIIANAQQVHDMLKDNTNMAEWVQSKITLAADYITTVADYMQSEVKEEVAQVDELRTSTMLRYATKANKALIGGDRSKEEKRIKGIQKANYKIQTRHSVKEDTEQVDEAKHRVSVTVSEPDHPMVTKRKEQQQKFVRVSGEKEGAVSKAQQHFKKQGYKVHGAEYVGAVNEDIEQVDETPAYTKDDAYSSFGSIKPHRTLKIANVLKPEKDASARAERLMSKAGVRTNEAKSLYDRHQEIRKKSGLPDPSYYLKKMKEKQAEIEALRSQSNQGSTERLHGISHDDHPGAQRTFTGLRNKS
jgi:hypothetical protein